MGIGAAGREELVAGEECILPGAAGGTGKATDRALVRGTIAFTYSTITTFIVIYGLGHTATFSFVPLLNRSWPTRSSRKA